MADQSNPIHTTVCLVHTQPHGVVSITTPLPAEVYVETIPSPLRTKCVSVAALGAANGQLEPWVTDVALVIVHKTDGLTDLGGPLVGLTSEVGAPAIRTDTKDKPALLQDPIAPFTVAQLRASGFVI